MERWFHANIATVLEQVLGGVCVTLDDRLLHDVPYLHNGIRQKLDMVCLLAACAFFFLRSLRTAGLVRQPFLFVLFSFLVSRLRMSLVCVNLSVSSFLCFFLDVTNRILV